MNQLAWAAFASGKNSEMNSLDRIVHNSTELDRTVWNWGQRVAPVFFLSDSGKTEQKSNTKNESYERTI